MAVAGDLPPELLREIEFEPAAKSSKAAQTLVVRDVLTRDQFETLFDPMPLAGIDPNRLVPNTYRPNTAVVEAFIALIPILTAEQVTQDGVLEASAAWSTERIVEWSAPLDAAWSAAQRAGRCDAYVVAPRNAGWVVPAPIQALVVRDPITPEQFGLLFAPMRSAGIDPDRLVPNSDG